MNFNIETIPRFEQDNILTEKLKKIVQEEITLKK